MKIKEYIGSKIYDLITPYMKGGENMKANTKAEYDLEEKFVWYKGNENLIAEFYQNKDSSEEYVDTKSEYYYKYAGQDGIRVVHSGIPKLLCKTNAKLVYGKGIDIKADKNGKEDEETNELINDIRKENELPKKIKSLIANSTWAGKVAYKITYDNEVSKNPIIEVYDALSYKAYRKLGKLQEIHFSTMIDDKYELIDIRGKGFIDYKLYEIKNGKKKEINLTDLEETQELERIEIKNSDIILAGEIETESKYDGIISEFDALDEAWSQYLDEVRLARSEEYIPENKLSNKTWNKFRKQYAVLEPDLSENAKNEIVHIQPDIRSDEYKKTIALITNNILVNAGFSPFTCGIDDGIGANASGESLIKREITSLRTRESEIEPWEEFISEMIYKLLFAYAYFNDTNFDNKIEIIASFGEYISPDRNEKIQQSIDLKENGIIDVEQALKEVYNEDLTDEEKERILINTGNYTDTEEVEEEKEIEE